MMRFIRAVLLLTLCLFLATSTRITTRAQTATPSLLSLDTASTDVQTGKEYSVDIKIDTISDLWLADMEIEYDPSLVYILGTKAGSPVKQGVLFTPADSTVTVRNVVQSKRVQFTLSMLAPANPISGGGVVGTFRIYPLAPGVTQITFAKASLLKVNFATDESGQRVGKDSQPIPFTPVLLKLNITGDKVPPPQEATATPLPTETPEPSATVQGQPTSTIEPTLINATAGPQITPTPLKFVELPTQSDSSGPLLIGGGLLAIAIIGLLVLVFFWSRSRRR